jgi:hypothetical protein
MLFGLAAMIGGLMFLLARPDSLPTLQVVPVASPTVPFHELDVGLDAYEPPRAETKPPSTARTFYAREQEQEEEHEAEMRRHVEQQPRRRRLKRQQAPTQLASPESPPGGWITHSGMEDSASPAQLVQFLRVPDFQLLLYSTAVVLVMAISMVPVLRWWERNRAFLKTVVTQKRRELVQAAPKQVRTGAVRPSSKAARGV